MKIIETGDNIALGLQALSLAALLPQRVGALVTRHPKLFSTEFVNKAFYLSNSPLSNRINPVFGVLGLAGMIWTGGRAIQKLAAGKGDAHDALLVLGMTFGLGGMGVRVLGARAMRPDLLMLSGILSTGSLLSDALDVTLSVIEASDEKKSFVPVLLQAGLTVFFGFSHNTKNPTRLSRYSATTVNEVQAKFIADDATETAKRMKAGLDAYRAELNSRPQCNDRSDPFGMRGDVDPRGRYLQLRSRQMQTDARMESWLLDGMPDALGNKMGVHAEVYHPLRKAPKGVTFIITGYGETVAMYDDTIQYAIRDGFAVVAVDTRGHGFSGHPLGLEGYMESADNTVADLQIALNRILKQKEWQDLPLFGFGFSQGALLHTRLDQLNPGVYKALGLISPTHDLGTRFNKWTPEGFEPLAVKQESKNMLPLAYADAPDAPKTIFPRTPKRLSFQEWQDWGFGPRRFIRNDSTAFWNELIGQVDTHARNNGGTEVPATVLVGTKDNNIGGVQVLEKTRIFLGSRVNSFTFEGKDHQLHLENDVGDEIRDKVFRYFTQMAQ